MKNTKYDGRISPNMLVITVNAHGLNSPIRDTTKIKLTERLNIKRWKISHTKGSQKKGGISISILKMSNLNN